MDSVIKNYEEVPVKPPSTRLYLKFLRHKWQEKRINKKLDKMNKTHDIMPENIPPENIEVYSFAIVLDDIVVDVMHVQKEFGELLKQNAKFVFVDKDQHRPHQGWVYRDGKFLPFEDLIEESRPTTRG